MRPAIWIVSAAVAFGSAGCRKQSGDALAAAVAGRGRVLLVAQARFVDEPQPDGSTRPRPGPATLLVLRDAPDGWTAETIDDPDSNVFHKAIVFDPGDGAGPGILTIGAVGAYLKTWRPAGESWSATTLWHARFGGRFDRLRDVEIGDVTGDGEADIVIATHDQGVVAVLRRVGGRWEPTEMDKRPGIFVHEVEIGDVDGDGKNEFFTTPSQPNVAGAREQGGQIDAYRWNGASFDRSEVVRSGAAHAKEILAADLDGDGRAALWAVLEAYTEAGADCRVAAGFVPLRIVRYDFEGGRFAERDVAGLPDCMCRFLAWGDVDGDGKNEIVAATKNAGVFLLRLDERGEAAVEPVDADSAGFEHATLVADLDADGTAEIYVAADKQAALRRYVWNPATRTFDRSTILDLGINRITWGVTAGTLP
ncbi:MAG: FG-GAP-like repeat-containing protein [Myxococcota bacterium]|nr:FG-GAP-like repeat-containing protein [Myxococcota bacterium]